MSAPTDRLVSDHTAESLSLHATAVLQGPKLSPLVQELAASIELLLQDRAARLELAAYEARR